MKIGMVDVDGHHYPNLALMKLSAWHKARGDTVEWWWSDLFHYDVVYMSKVFSDTYTPDQPEPLNTDRVIKGGTGYAITLEDGLEVYHPERDKPLPPEIEHIYPDYSFYPETPDIRSAAAVDSTEIERIVRHVLAQQQTAAPSFFQQGGQGSGEAAIPWEEPDNSLSETRNPAEDADKAAILQTLDAFRKQ